MGWFSQSKALLRGRFSAILLTSALALLPANLLGAGALRFGVGLLAGGEGDKDHPASDKERLLFEKNAPPAGRASTSLGTLFALAGASFLGLALLLVGVALAHAALVPVILGTGRSPSEAWALVAGRMGALLRTGVQGALLIALGMVLFVLPGIAAML